MKTPSPMSLSHLKFRHLMLVEFLVRHGTLHKAARLLNISQPAATGMLNDLEQLLGISLFTRSRLGVAPTPSAQALLAKVRTLLNEFNDFTTAVGRAAEGRDVVLRVGVVPQAFVAYMPQTIEIFRARGGGALRAQEGTARQLLDLLLDGQLDCVIGRLPSDGLPEGRRASDLSMEPVYRDEVCLVARPGHSILDARKVGFERLAQEQWVLQRRDSSVRRALAEAVKRRAPGRVIVQAGHQQQLFTAGGEELFTAANTDFLQGLDAIGDKRRAHHQYFLHAAFRQLIQPRFGVGLDPLRPAQSRLKRDRPFPLR